MVSDINDKGCLVFATVSGIRAVKMARYCKQPPSRNATRRYHPHGWGEAMGKMAINIKGTTTEPFRLSFILIGAGDDAETVEKQGFA